MYVFLVVVLFVVVVLVLGGWFFLEGGPRVIKNKIAMGSIPLLCFGEKRDRVNGC